MKKVIFLSLLMTLLFNSQASSNQQIDNYVKVAKTIKPNSEHFKMGTFTNPTGSTITFNSQCMLRDGKSILPVMGEFHFSRYPDSDWRRELLKMRAGGINIVSTYVFWIHHEEVEGIYNWEG